MKDKITNHNYIITSDNITKFLEMVKLGDGEYNNWISEAFFDTLIFGKTAPEYQGNHQMAFLYEKVNKMSAELSELREKTNWNHIEKITELEDKNRELLSKIALLNNDLEYQTQLHDEKYEDSHKANLVKAESTIDMLQNDVKYWKAQYEKAIVKINEQEKLIKSMQIQGAKRKLYDGL